MSLRTFHLIFIAAAALLAFGTGLWAFLNVEAFRGSDPVVVGIMAVFTGFALGAYALRMRGRLKRTAGGTS